MKKIILFIAVLLIGCTSFIYAQGLTHKENNLTISPPEKSLRIGEKFEYSVEWLGVPFGRIALNVLGIEKIDGNECYHVLAYAIPNKFFRKLYDVEYTVHTYINAQTFYTHRFEKTRRVKNRFNYEIIDFDRKKKEVKYRNAGSADAIKISSARVRIATMIPTTLKILNGVQDLFSSLYYFRLLDLKESKSYLIDVYYNQRNWKLAVKVGKPFLKDIRKKGSFAVFGVSMDSDLSTFILGKRKLLVYFTSDSRRIPIEFKFSSSIGLIRGIIQNPPN